MSQLQKNFFPFPFSLIFFYFFINKLFIISIIYFTFYSKTRHCGLNFWGCMASTIHLSSSAHQYLYGECHGEKAGRWFCAQAARCRHKALRFAF